MNTAHQLYTVVGIEGGVTNPVSVGTPAVRDANGIFNPVSGRRVSEEQFAKLVDSDHVTVDFIPEVHLTVELAEFSRRALRDFFNAVVDVVNGKLLLSESFLHASFRNRADFRRWVDDFAIPRLLNFAAKSRPGSTVRLLYETLKYA